jgi:hypothetical protein
MAEANPSIQQTTTTAQARITTAALVRAKLRARQAVKEELRREGLKVSHFAVPIAICCWDYDLRQQRRGHFPL